MKRTVNDILREKSSDVWTIGPDETVFDAIGLIAKKGIGALLVMEGEQVVGMFTERDYARKVVLEGRSSRKSLVRDVMSTKLTSVKTDQPVRECMELMTEKRIRHLPVVEENKLLGLISIGDLVKNVIAEQEYLINQLEGYISG